MVLGWSWPHHKCACSLEVSREEAGMTEEFCALVHVVYWFLCWLWPQLSHGHASPSQLVMLTGTCSFCRPPPVLWGRGCHGERQPWKPFGSLSSSSPIWVLVSLSRPTADARAFVLTSTVKSTLRLIAPCHSEWFCLCVSP